MRDPDSQHFSPPRLLATYYISVLMLVALGIISALAIERSLAPQVDGSADISVSARQRLLTQRIAKVLLLLDRTDESPELRQEHLRELATSFDTLVEGHRILRFGDEASGVLPADDPELARLFLEFDQPFEQVTSTLRPLVERIKAGEDPSASEIQSALAVFRAQEGDLLRLSEAVVSRRQALHREYATDAIQLVRRLTTVMVIVIVLQVLFVMRPLLLRVRSQMIQQEKLVQELKSRTDDLRAQEAEARRLAQVASRTGNAVVITNAKAEIEWVNEAFVRLSGYTFDEVRGRRPGSFLQCEKSDPRTVERMRRQIANGEGFTVEILNRNKNGRDYWLLIECQPIFNEAGELTNFIAVETDLTERVEAQEELQSLVRFQRTLMDNAPDGVIATDVEGIITVYNPAAEHMFGYAPSEVIGQMTPVALLDPVEMKARMQERSEEFEVTLDDPFDALVIRNHHVLPNQFDWTFVRKGGARFPGRLNVAELRTSTGNISGYIAIASDTTEERKVADQLRQAKEQAEAGGRAKADFLANMSQEIRTPLNAVIGMTGLLLDTPLTPEQREFAGTVRTSGEALLALINDILDFSKIDAGKLDLERVPFSIRRCVEEVGDLVAQRASEKHLEIALLVHHDVPEFVEGDPTRIRQVLLNLASNAVKFTERGEVTLEVEVLRSGPSDARVRFSVRDTGIGIPAEKIPLLFQSFSQTDTSTTRRFGGTGLGLAISQRLITMMGSRIEVQSDTGKGSCFLFELDLPTTAPIEAAATQPIPIAGCRVLVVDDNETNRRVLREQLRAWKCECTEVASAAEALGLLRSGQNFCLALVDFQMPGMNGEELARAIRDDAALAGLRLILLTSSPRAGDTRRMRDAGFDAFLTKPVKQSQLHDAISVVLSGAAPRTTRPDSPLVTAELIAELARRPARILLVEDNLVNQRVAIRMLERAGLRCDVAANGIEAIEAVQRISYDLVLMDCQMPEMDGYDATAAIRQLEGPVATVPIVAMTAEALKGDRERCIAAGMDDYLTKPIDPQMLYTTIDRYLKRVEPARNPGPKRLDLDALADSLGGNREVLRELLRQFLRMEGELVRVLGESITSGTNAPVAAATRALASACDGIQAHRLAILCRELEASVRQGRLTGTQAQVKAVVDEAEELRQVIQAEIGMVDASRSPG